MKPSILRNLGIAFIAFGLLMGIVFPFYADFFVEWKPGMYGWFVAGCLVAGTTIGVVNFVLVNVVLLRKLRQISSVANAISNKDISFECKLRSDDVVGEIAESFNLMTVNLRTIVGRIAEATGQLTDASTEMRGATEASREQARRQNQETDGAVAATQRITASTTQVADGAAEAARAAREAQSHAEGGRRVVTATVTRIEGLAREVERAGQAIDALAQDSAAIGAVLDVIRGIAEQTNLLALNAAIEAARAGESGRGFAVVADEVRTLATRSHEATQEIQQMVERIQNGTGEVVEVIRQGREQAQESVDQAQEAGHTLEAIAEAVGNITRLNAHIADASAEQQAAADEVTRNVSGISSIAEASVEDIAQLAQAGETLDGLARELRRYIAEFRT